MNPKTKFAIAGAIIAAVITVSFIANPSPLLSQNNTTTATNVLRIGYFPNINHAQAVIGLGNGDFQKALDDIKVETQIFNAGPSSIEALFANRVDVTYVGPNPAINGYIKSDGEVLRIISGAASGGAVFVVRNDAGINSADDFAGKKFASPQLGNTQDVALRAYLLKHGYQTTENGGNVEVIPIKNPDILTLMLKKEVDGAWVPEPWGAKLLKETDSRIFVDERDLWPEGKFVTAHIIVNTEYLENHPEIVKKLLAAHVDETIWINQNKEEASKVFNIELEKLTGKAIPEDEFQEAFSRMEITYDPVKDSLFKSANDAFDIGFLGDTRPDISKIYDLTLLNKVLEEKNLSTIP
ncbi:MAG: ABC transporter substrate-binding protein [Thaumarchaeota archaeon]|nr:ABC transporter substrate-binding protein [Nitrososphaerota archaeon]